MRRAKALRLIAMLLGATMLAVIVGVPEVAAQRAEDPRAARARVRAEAARTAADIDAAKASLAQVEHALDALSANLRTQRRLLDRAQRRLGDAVREARAAGDAVERISLMRAITREEMRRRAVDAYVNPFGDQLFDILGSASMTEAGQRRAIIELRALRDADVADRLRGLDSDLRHQKARKDLAEHRAALRRREQQTRTRQVAVAREDQQRLARRLRARIRTQVARALALARTDRELSARILQDQARIAARLAEQRAAAQRARAASLRADGSENRPVAATGGARSATGAPVALARVGGALINASIASRAAAMINAARRDGVGLSINNAYRDPAEQIALRRQNCGTSSYAMYQMSSGACSPPTARPGSSQHELGLAIDFGGCGTRSTACYRWLAGHAAAYGFYNLPSESWHWSVTGT